MGCDAHVAEPVRLERDQAFVGIRPLLGRQRTDDRVGSAQDPCPAAEVGEQRQPLRGFAVAPPEGRGEVEQVGQRRAAPGVDVLIRVPHGRDRMPAPEQGLDQPGLGDVRVLVLVQQHGAEAVAVLPADLRM